MAELGEMVTVALILDMDSACPFSHEKPKHEKQNDLTNNPSKLGRNLGGGDPIPLSFYVRGRKFEMELGFGAHHLVPGDASLNKATALLKLMKKGEMKGDIGYGVNHERNGVWLPGNYRWDAASKGKWSTLGASGGFEVQFAYAYYAMQVTGRQFHDSHTDYSAWVRRTLEKIRVKTLALQAGCDECKEINAKKPWNPPYTLVGVIDRLSSRLRGYVTGPVSRWKPPFCTSSMAVLVGAGWTPEKVARL